jgi:predicted dienelactone hydrolase
LTSGPTPALAWFPTAADTGSAIEYFEGIEGTALEDASADCSEVRPVVLHSHGNGSASFEMAWVAEHLATHGVVTLAVDHVGNTYYEQTDDFIRLYEQRPTDIAELYDLLLTQLAGPGGLLEGCVDPDAGYLVSGYSFGGYTAYAVAGARVNNTMGSPSFDFGDSRAKAVLTYAPWDGGGALSEGMAEVAVPAFTVGAARDGIVFQQYNALHGSLTSTPRVLGDFPEAGHYTFIEWCSVYLFEEGCGTGWVDLAAFEGQVKQSTAAFVGHVEGDADALDSLASEDGLVTWTAITE